MAKTLRHPWAPWGAMAELTVDSEFETTPRTIIALIISVLVGAVANAAGVGGGAIYIPIFNALVGFGLKASTALSQVCITAGAVTSLAANLARHHPADPAASLVELSLMLMLTPVLLVGVGVGVILNVMLPAWLLTALLLLLLVPLVWHANSKCPPPCPCPVPYV
ncbi:hypothetical protein TSOC_001769 [Tetrabaena socialis]|uniref:Uncharacterized protein n=1 Tax=Tetrabaena socialis TaxID=47790 RepID=A0A2J8AFR1_9CHLO|nr:hypothetical protein TSOC_001769 [Tetrabaena socialis]|eukprot:PNH11358.1 hypothetical protein TSOC_001769 [Tetrabaena socialis]